MIHGRTMSWYEPGDKIPTAEAECCRTWEVPLQGWKRCGLCKTKPEFKRILPEDEWPVVPGPKR